MLIRQLRSTVSRGFFSNSYYVRTRHLRQCKFTSVYFRQSYQVAATQYDEPQNNFLNMLKIADEFKFQISKRINQKNNMISRIEVKQQGDMVRTILQDDYMMSSLYEKAHDRILEMVVEEMRQLRQQTAEQRCRREYFHRVLMILRIMYDFRINDMDCWSQVIEQFCLVSESFKDFPDLTLEIFGEFGIISNLFVHDGYKLDRLSNEESQEVNRYYLLAKSQF